LKKDNAAAMDSGLALLALSLNGGIKGIDDFHTQRSFLFSQSYTM